MTFGGNIAFFETHCIITAFELMGRGEQPSYFGGPLLVQFQVMGSGAFLAAAVCGGQRGGQICIWGPRIPDDIMHD